MTDENFFDIIDSLKDIIDSEKSGPRATAPTDTDAYLLPFLYEISALLTTGTTDVREALETVLDVALKVTRATRGFIILFDEQRKFDVQIARNNKQLNLDPSEFAVSRSVINKALAERKAIFIPNVHDDLVIKNAASVIDLELLSAMCVPLQFHVPKGLPGRKERRRFQDQVSGDALGVVYVDSNQTINPLREEDLYFFEALANHATAAIINARLYHQATTDPLSKLYTRRQFEILLHENIRRSEQSGTPLSLLMVDIDHFKRVNDNFGHPVGDEVIRQVSEIMRGCVRSADVCSRYGGEEFAVLLLDTDATGGQVLAEKIRRTVQTHRFEDSRLKATISLGVATCPVHTTDERELVKKSDQALYRAKEGGRNRVEVWNEHIGEAAQRTDKLAGIITGDFARDYRNVTMVLDTIKAVNSTMEVDHLLVMTLDKIIEATGAERGAILLVHDADRSLRPAVARDRHGTTLDETAKFSASIPRQVASTGVSVSVVDTLEDGETEYQSSILDLNLRQVMCVPLPVRDEVIGVIYVDSRTVSNEMAASNLLFFEALARQVAFAIENFRIHAQLEYERGRKASE
ncbi:MAG: diguanylate cyclase [Planctomycetes bacterium]|nr:diguanylate cyclase [Planctomycetota bacterium]